MQKYGIYDTTSESIICDPISNYAHLRGILERHGVSAADLWFDAPQQLHHLWVLPGICEDTGPPASHGYEACPAGGWVVDIANSRMVRHAEYKPSEFAGFVKEVKQVIADQSDAAKAAIEQDYSQFEVDTWPAQKSESEAWIVDNSAPTPTLAEISIRRNIPLNILVERVLSNVSVAGTLTGIVMGDAQAAGDQIKALQEADELPSDWFAQLQEIARSWRKDWPVKLLADPIHK